jgi:GT2 family glycosyltransferase
MDDPTLAIVIPTYGAFSYAEKAISTALACSLPSAHIIVVDDASPDGVDAFKNLYAMFEGHRSRLTFYRFSENGGLTRSWNKGLEIARRFDAHYTCVTNSDVLFPTSWEIALIAALDVRGAHLVGPVTNAPGTQANQDIDKYTYKYKLTDDQKEINRLSNELTLAHGSDFHEGAINGFCMMAETSTWWKHAYDKEHVFRPSNDFNSKGEPNPTPLMTLQEYELQGRWKKAGLKIGFCPGSFVFHYRSVTRGDKHRKGKSYRMGQ